MRKAYPLTLIGYRADWKPRTPVPLTDFNKVYEEELRELDTRQCRVCGKDYVARAHNQMTCAATCQQKLTVARKKEQRLAKAPGV